MVEGACWLCGCFGPLTREHIPPKSAFNSVALRVERVSEEQQKRGKLGWVPGERHQSGYTTNTLCESCNKKGGRSFAPPYAELAHRVADGIRGGGVFDKLILRKVRRPQLVFRQVVFQLISSTGANFVAANPWISSLRTRSELRLPPEVRVYLYAVNRPIFKVTGMASHVTTKSDAVHVLTELTFFPLGTVLSFGELPYEGLTPITDWNRFRFSSKETVDVELRINPVWSPLPVDFRMRSQLLYARHFRSPHTPAIEESLIRKLAPAVAIRSGSDSDDTVLLAHPSQVDKLASKRERESISLNPDPE